MGWRLLAAWSSVKVSVLLARAVVVPLGLPGPLPLPLCLAVLDELGEA